MNAPDRFIPRPAVTASEIAYEMAEAEFLASPAKYAAWLASVDGDRHPAGWFFTSMSVSELLWVQMGSDFDDEQRAEATLELRNRYLKDQCADIAARSLELMGDGKKDNSWTRRQDAAERIAR